MERLKGPEGVREKGKQAKGQKLASTGKVVVRGRKNQVVTRMGGG